MENEALCGIWFVLLVSTVHHIVVPFKLTGYSYQLCNDKCWPYQLHGLHLSDVVLSRPRLPSTGCMIVDSYSYRIPTSLLG